MTNQQDPPAPRRSLIGRLFSGIGRGIILVCFVLIPALAAGIKVYEFGRDQFFPAAKQSVQEPATDRRKARQKAKRPGRRAKADRQQRGKRGKRVKVTREVTHSEWYFDIDDQETSSAHEWR